jgi:hypothetical protein
MVPSIRRRVNPSAKARANAAVGRRRSRLRSFSPHEFRSHFSSLISVLSLNVSSRKINSEQIDETLITFALQQRIKVTHQANIERKLKLKLQRIKAQSVTFKQSLKNDSTSKSIISQTSNIILSSDSCIQAIIARYLFIDITQLINILKNEFQAVNIFKLINDYILNSVSKQDLQLTSFNKLQAHDDNIIQQNFKNMILFLYYLKVYN